MLKTSFHLIAKNQHSQIQVWVNIYELNDLISNTFPSFVQVRTVSLFFTLCFQRSSSVQFCYALPLPIWHLLYAF
jgi:hypothetical protein